MIVGNNSILNQYVPTFYIKNLLDGQVLKYDSVRKAFVNATGSGGTGANKLGELLNVSSTVDSPNPSLHNGQGLVYNAFTSLWENAYIDYNTLINKPVVGNGTVTSVSGGGTVSGLTLTGTITTSGSLTLGGTLNLTSGQVTSGLGFTPYNSTNPAGYTSNTGTLTSVNAAGFNGVIVSGVPVIGSAGTIDISLGAITPSSVAASGTVTGSNLSGSNTGDQTITLTGAVTGTGTGTFATTYAGNLPVTNLNSGTGASATTFWRGDGIWSTPAGGGTVTNVSITGTSDITASVINPTTTPAISVSLATTGVTLGTYGSSTQVPVFTVDNKGRISNVTNTAIVGGSSSPEIVVLQYTSGASGTFTGITPNVIRAPNTSVTITDGANCVATYAFSNKSNPPKSITLYGQNFATNTFAITSMPGPNFASANIKIAGGGTAASPDLVNGIFTSSNILTLQSTMAYTGASASIGQRAWLIVVFGF